MAMRIAEKLIELQINYKSNLFLKVRLRKQIVPRIDSFSGIGTRRP
jgi:hypothetical protein